MRTLIIDRLREWHRAGDLTDTKDDGIIDFKTEVEPLTDEALLELYEYNAGFQG